MNAPSFMDLALKTAKNAGKSGEVPIGCVIVRNYEVIATASNRTLTDRDPTAHAEVLAIRQAAERIGTERLTDCDLYVTLEPCTTRGRAICFARIRRLYYGAADPKGWRGRQRRAVLCAADMPSCPGGLLRPRRKPVSGDAERVFPAVPLTLKPPPSYANSG